MLVYRRVSLCIFSWLVWFQVVQHFRHEPTTCRNLQWCSSQIDPFKWTKGWGRNKALRAANPRGRDCGLVASDGFGLQPWSLYRIVEMNCLNVTVLTARERTCQIPILFLGIFGILVDASNKITWILAACQQSWCIATHDQDMRHCNSRLAELFLCCCLTGEAEGWRPTTWSDLKRHVVMEEYTCSHWQFQLRWKNTHEFPTEEFNCTWKAVAHLSPCHLWSCPQPEVPTANVSVQELVHALSQSSQLIRKIQPGPWGGLNWYSQPGWLWQKRWDPRIDLECQWPSLSNRCFQSSFEMQFKSSKFQTSPTIFLRKK